MVSHGGKTTMIRQSAGKTSCLAYFVGMYLGDGWMGYVKSLKGWYFRLNTIDKDFAEMAKKTIKELTGNEGHICIHPVKKSSKPNHSYTSSVKDLYWVRQATQDKQRFPEFVNSWNREEKLALISGLMDSEGYVATTITHPGAISIGLKATSKWMDDLYSLCQELGISVGKIGKETLPSGKIATRFHFKSKSFVENGCYFNIERKQKRIDEWNLNPQRLYVEHGKVA